MKAYLKIVNPAIAVVTLLLCFWAATFSDGKFNFFGIVAGNLSTYFFAKGLFTFSSIFLMGNILLQILTRGENNVNAKTSKKN